MADRVIDSSEGSAWGPARVPPVSVGSAISIIKRQLNGDGDSITLSRDEALALVQSQANHDSQKAELERADEELRRYYYLSQFGDYARRVVDWVMNSTAKKNDMPSTVPKLREALAKEISTNPERDGRRRVYLAIP